MPGSSVPGSSRAGGPDPWVVGWVVGAAVVAVAAGLLATITALARRVAAQAGDIEAAIQASTDNVQRLLDLPAVNASVARGLDGLRPEPAGSDA